MTESVAAYFEEGCQRCPLRGTPDCKVHNWGAVLKALRELIRGSELEEESKWGVPCYTLNGKNVLLLSAFNDYWAFH